jgi:hypothetical protein
MNTVCNAHGVFLIKSLGDEDMLEIAGRWVSRTELIRVGQEIGLVLICAMRRYAMRLLNSMAGLVQLRSLETDQPLLNWMMTSIEMHHLGESWDVPCRASL